MIKITLPGEPIRKISPTFSKFGTYNKQKPLLHATQFQVLDQIKKYPSCPFPSSVPIEIEFKFYFSIPSSKENLFDWGLLHHLDTPDVDNNCKFYCDVLKKHVFEDDRQIERVIATKSYSHDPRTEIHIMPKQPECSDQVKELLSIVPPSEVSEISAYLSSISEWCLKSENPFHAYEDGIIDFEEVALTILEFAEKYADTFKKINKK